MLFIKNNCGKTKNGNEKELIEKLKDDLSEPNLQIFKNSVSTEFNNDSLSLIVSDTYMKQWVENKCFSLISSYVNCAINIEINEEELSSETNQLELFHKPPTIQPSKFNSLFSFDRFIVGNNNRFAFAAAEAVAKRPSKAYNPLYIYGSVGIGKTHLLHAIANEISKQNYPFVWLRQKKFTNDLINSLEIDQPPNLKINIDRLMSF